MSPPAPFLSPAEAARQLGVSAKALRLYEERGLVSPLRSAAGWRTYGPAQMARLGEIVALRGFGLSLAQVKRVLDGDAASLDAALSGHLLQLRGQSRKITAAIEAVEAFRADLAQGRLPGADALARLLQPPPSLRVAFDLPWPWAGERFELRDLPPLTYIVGPLGSGKTRLAMAVAESLPGAVFLGLDRRADQQIATGSGTEDETGRRLRVARILAWLVEDGATTSDALLALLDGLEVDGADAVVVDMVEQGLDQATQHALMAHLRGRPSGARPLFLMTRSSAIMDLATMGADEAIILCPANHSPPSRVAPYPGSPGYEATATCLATPEVRARTQGVVARRPQVA